LILKDGYTYHDDSPDPQAVTSRDKEGAVESFTYDVDGNMVTATRGGETTTYTWDAGGRLRTSTRPGEGTATYLYGAEGERVVKSQSCAGVASTCRAGDDIYIGPLELRGSEQAADGGLAGYYNLSLGPVVAQLALRREVNGLLVRDPEADRSYHLDHLGSTALVTAHDGRPENPFGAAGRLDYAPYGEPLFRDMNVARVWRRYSGKELDSSGLFFFGSRYYDPAVGRWLGRDPASIARPFASEMPSVENNVYAFAAANPIRWKDPDGRQSIPAGQGTVLRDPLVADAPEIKPTDFSRVGSRAFGIHSTPSDPKYILPFVVGLFNPVVGVAIATYLATSASDAVDVGLMAVSGGPKGGSSGALKSGVPDGNFVPKAGAPRYSRPKEAGPTAEQRAYVQGMPCVDCGAVTPRQVADHKEPLVVEHYRTGTIDVEKQSSLEAVQAHCPTCSAVQGGQLSWFSKLMRQLLALLSRVGFRRR
jgi:RHS repeat-associated protein